MTNDFYTYLESRQIEYSHLLELPVVKSTININQVIIEPKTLTLNIDASIRQSQKCVNDVYVFINNSFLKKISSKLLDFQKDQCHFIFSIPRDRPPKEFELKLTSVEDGYLNSTYYVFDSEGNYHTN